MPVPDSRSILQKARAARRRRSPVRAWVEENYDELLREPPSWRVLARDLGAAGLRDAKGKRPTDAALKLAFARVRAERQGKRSAPVIPTPAPQQPRAGQADTPDVTFTPVRKKGPPQ